MTDGFKSGPGDDPFADDGDSGDGGDSREAGDDTESGQASTTDPFAEDRSRTSPDAGDGSDDLDLPWVLERDSVKDGRPKTMEFRMRPETAEHRRDFKADVERELGKDVFALDLREAAYLVAMNHPGEVAEQLRKWGYDYL
jgi:hypothetical protein